MTSFSFLKSSSVSNQQLGKVVKVLRTVTQSVMVSLSVTMFLNQYVAKVDEKSRKMPKLVAVAHTITYWYNTPNYSENIIILSLAEISQITLSL